MASTARVLDERIECDAAAREGEKSSRRGDSATRTEPTPPRLTEVGRAGFVHGTGAAANTGITRSRNLPPGYYWLASIVTWWAIINLLTRLLAPY